MITSAVWLAPVPAAEADAIRPFHINVPEEALVDLRRRVAATRRPDPETVNDQFQGVRLVKLQELVRYWGHQGTRETLRALVYELA